MPRQLGQLIYLLSAVQLVNSSQSIASGSRSMSLSARGRDVGCQHALMPIAVVVLLGELVSVSATRPPRGRHAAR